MEDRLRNSNSARHAFKAFLSHSYKSHEINLYFFALFSDIAEVQFEVDEGGLSTNVTRLERMLRGCDGFIGIYPFPGSSADARSSEELLRASRYFRLELDLAIRSRKPVIVFSDERYGQLLRPPEGALWRPFDPQEVAGSGGSPQAGVFQKAFRQFSEIVRASMAYQLTLPFTPKTCVAIALPQSVAGRGGYTVQHLEAIESTLSAHGYFDLQRITWPPTFDRRTAFLLNDVEFVITDFGEKMAATGLSSYMHGQFIPTIRLRRNAAGPSDLTRSHLERFLFGATEAGYIKVLIPWSDLTSINAGLNRRLSRLGGIVRRINTATEAESYFRSAALRPEAVFLSYSGRNRELAAQLSRALKKRFVRVFDYRDGSSLEPGQPWLPEIFDQLTTSAVGVPLLSVDYLESGNCVHEAQEMVARVDAKKMTMFPIALGAEPMSLPTWLQNIQYLIFSDYDNAEEIASVLVKDMP